MKSVYPKKELSTLSKRLVVDVAVSLTKSGPEDKILRTESLIRDFCSNNRDSLNLVRKELLDQSNDLSYISELHPTRIKWIESIIEQYEKFRLKNK